MKDRYDQEIFKRPVPKTTSKPATTPATSPTTQPLDVQLQRAVDTMVALVVLQGNEGSMSATPMPTMSNHHEVVTPAIVPRRVRRPARVDRPSSPKSRIRRPRSRRPSRAAIHPRRSRRWTMRCPCPRCPRASPNRADITTLIQCMPTILAIESTCDETGAAVVVDGGDVRSQRRRQPGRASREIPRRRARDRQPGAYRKHPAGHSAVAGRCRLRLRGH